VPRPRWDDVPPWVRTVLLSGALVLTAVALFPIAVGEPAAAATPGLVLRWWELVPLFALAEVLVVHLEINREAHSFTLSELPFVLALLFADPGELILARLVGEAITLALYERQTPVKLTFNLSLFAAESCLALTVFHLLGGSHGGVSAVGWLLSGVAVCAAAALSVACVRIVIGWHGGHVRPRVLLATAAATAICNAGLAGVTAVILSGPRWALLPLAIAVAVVVTGYRGYTRLTARYTGLELLYQFTRLTGGATRPEQTIASVLEEARRLLRAELAMITLDPAPDDPAPDDPTTDPTTGPMQPPVCLPAERRPAALPAVLARRVLSGGETVLLRRGTRDPELSAALDQLGVTDALCAPMVSGGAVIGTLTVGDRLGEVSTFDRDDALLFTTLATQAGVALANCRLIEQLHDQALAREHEALHDALTGMPNRLLFARELAVVLDAARRDDSRFAVLLMDLDQFKEVNDTLGHHTGDLLLQEMAGRLNDVIGDRGLVARLGGDEFVVLLPELRDTAEAIALAAQLHQRMTEPIRLASLLLEVGASVGVAVRPDHGDDAAVLLQRADVAMYTAKRARDRVALYDPRTDWNSPMRLQLAGEMRGALEHRQIDVHYQPIARAADDAIVTVEALVRWNHPQLGELEPEEFIPIAERTGLIGPLTLYVLEHALSQCRRWQAEDDLDLRVAVNLSVQVLLDVEWPAKVLGLLLRHQVDCDRLTFEITETGIMSDPQSMIPVLNELAAAGVAFSIDDFGTGYSSLSYLQRLPVSEIKIDKSFVLPMAADPAAAGLVASVIDLARSLQLRIIAEGVEDQLTLDRLAEMRCDYLQGFFFSPAMPAPELTRWLHGRRTPRLAGSGG